MLTTHPALAADYTGTISQLTAWVTGNVDFKLALTSTGEPPCNGQFILNRSDPGTKNMYAALLAAKKTGTPVRVTSTACGPAENYNGGDYNLVTYIYVLD
jgi:hypothetical protein